MNLGSHDTLRRDLGISSKSLVHHWSKAGGPGRIPGYATHLRKLANISKYLESGGRVGIVIGIGAAYLNIKEACLSGDAQACEKIKFTETGNITGGLVFGAMAGHIGKRIAGVACLGLGPASAAVCSLVITGASSFTGSVYGASSGERMGEVIYETLSHE